MTNLEKVNLPLEAIETIIHSLQDAMEKDDHSWHEFSGIGFGKGGLEAYFVVENYGPDGYVESDHSCIHHLKTPIELQQYEPGGFTIYNVGLFNGPSLKKGDTLTIETEITQ